MRNIFLILAGAGLVGSFAMLFNGRFLATFVLFVFAVVMWLAAGAVDVFDVEDSIYDYKADSSFDGKDEPDPLPADEQNKKRFG